MSPGAPDSRNSNDNFAGLPKSFWLGLLIVLATAAAYWPVFSAGFIWDDDDYVTNNLTLRTLHGLWQIWFDPFATPQYYPFVHTTFWLEYHLWGLNPLGFHAVNLLLHTIGALLLWQVLTRLRLRGAWVMAMIFALHPVQVESVAWVTELKNVLSTLFYFSAALAYLRFAKLNGEPDPTKRKGFYGAALLLFIAALLCKTVACSLPAALLLVFWWKQERLNRNDILPLLPLFFVGICMGLMTAWIERHHVGAQGADWSLTFLDRALIATHALVFYCANLIWPSMLTFIYPRWDIDPHLLWQWIFPAVAVGVVAALWFARKKIGKGPLAAVLFFAGTLAPALGFVNVYPMRFTFVADHYQYLACAGIIVLVVSAAAALLEFMRADLKAQSILVITLLLVLAALTNRRSRIYESAETLWTDTLAKNPRCWMAHTNLGRLLAEGPFADAEARRRKLAGAEAQYQAAIAIRPKEDNVHYNYANLLFREGRLDEAVAQYGLTLEIAPDKPEAHNNLGIVLARLHRPDEAITEYEHAILDKPDYADAYFNLGNALSVEHKMDAAVAAYQHAVRLNPNSELYQKRLQALAGPAN